MQDVQLAPEWLTRGHRYFDDWCSAGSTENPLLEVEFFCSACNVPEKGYTDKITFDECTEAAAETFAMASGTVPQDYRGRRARVTKLYSCCCNWAGCALDLCTSSHAFTVNHLHRCQTLVITQTHTMGPTCGGGARQLNPSPTVFPF